MVEAIGNFIKRRRHQEMIKYYNRNGMLSRNATRVMLENLSVKVLSSQLGEVIVVPIHLKNDKRECINCRYLNLLSVPGKVNIGPTDTTCRPITTSAKLRRGVILSSNTISVVAADELMIYYFF